MKYSWTTIQTNDLEKSLLFYTKIVGLEENRRFGEGMDVEIIFLGNEFNSTEIELISNKNKMFEHLQSNSISLGFITESLIRTMDKLDEYGFTYESTILSPAPHLKFFYASDPNGVRIQFVELVGK